MPTAAARIITSLSADVHADPRTPDTTTYPTSAMLDVHTATACVMTPPDASDTMMPSPLSCITRYGTSDARRTSATTTTSVLLSYFATKKSACDTSLRVCAYRHT